MTPTTYVIATRRSWNEDLADRLRARTGHRFHLVTSPEALTVDRLSSYGPRYVFFPHWSTIIPPDIHQNFECVIFHMTDVPFGRGGSPLQNLIVRGIYETKISAIRCVEELDAGPVYLKRPLSLHGAASEIFLRSKAIIEEMIEEILRSEPIPTPQEGKATEFRRRKPADGELAPSQNLRQIFDFIRMLDADGYPNAYLDWGPYRLEFARARRDEGGIDADVRITKRSDG